MAEKLIIAVASFTLFMLGVVGLIVGTVRYAYEEKPIELIDTSTLPKKRVEVSLFCEPEIGQMDEYLDCRRLFARNDL